MLKLLGYPDKYSVAPGETIGFHISAEDNQQFHAELVRVICGDCNPEGPGLQFEIVTSGNLGTYQGRKQKTDAGSYMAAPVKRLPGTSKISFGAFIWPTLISRPDQTIIAIDTSEGALRLFLDEGVLGLGNEATPGQSLRCAQTPLLERQWYTVFATYDRLTGQAALRQTPRRRYAKTTDSGQVKDRIVPLPEFSGMFTVAGCPNGAGVGRHFDGKIEDPFVLNGIFDAGRHGEIRTNASNAFNPSLLARWDFSLDQKGTKATDISGNCNHGRFVNAPARGMKGVDWTGEYHRWTERRDHYGAVHFHHDDIYDAGWDQSLAWKVPDDCRSANYALRIWCGENTREATRDFYMPFFVRPPRRPAGVAGKRDRIAFLAPTASYIAYANHGEHITAREAEKQMGRLLEFGHADIYMYDHPEIGSSLYDTHADGSGVCYSSRLRPVLNFTSQYHSWLGGHGSAVWQYNADTHLLAWLEAKRFDFDVITDEDLHEESAHLLEDYRVIMTGTHPEYYSTNMWAGLKAWIDHGGRLMYLGANGFYWHIAFSDDMPGCMEVRRAEDGIRTWAAEPGEYYHSFSGEMSGLYRRRGHPPNEIGGIGFIAQGFDISSYYRRAPDADNARARFIFENVNDRIIGDFGLIGGGAAGLELDCITTELGSPPNTLRLATSENHSQMVMLVNEEFGVVPPNLGGDQNHRVRADLAFFETPSGGAVFSTGSIAWCGALPVNNFENNVSKITENVLRRFASEEKF